MAFIRLSLLNGCRKDKIRTLHWSDHREGLLFPRDSEPAARVVHLGESAVAVLRSIARKEFNRLVIAVSRPGTRIASLHFPWSRVRQRAGLDEVRIHDLRHSCATRSLFEEISSASRRSANLA